MDKKNIIIGVLIVLVVVLSCAFVYLTMFNNNQAEPADERNNEINDKKTEESTNDKTIDSTKEENADSSIDDEKTEGLRCDEYERISFESQEGQKAINELNRYYKKQNKDDKSIDIKKIEKCLVNIIGDGYAMGTDEKPQVIATFVSYYITTEENQKKYIYLYRPDADEDGLISDYTYRFN